MTSLAVARAWRRRLESLLGDPAKRRDFASGRQWAALQEHAARHGVLTVLQQGEETMLAAPQRSHLERQLAMQRLIASANYRSLEEILGVLRQAGVVVVVLKGPLLGERLIGPGSGRPSSDHDLLVAEADLAKACTALAELGYRAEAGGLAEFFRREHHHVHLFGPTMAGSLIELHFRLSSNFGVDLVAEPYLSRSLPYRTRNGVNCHILHPEDEFFYLAIHAAGHHFARLGWLYDLKLFLAKHPELDLDGIAEQAAAARLLCPFLLAMDLLRRLLGVRLRLDQSYERAARVRRQAGLWLMETCEAFAEGSLPARCASLCYQTTLCDTMRNGLRLLRRRWAFQWT